MTAQAAVLSYAPGAPGRTSSNGVLTRARELLISIVGPLRTTETTSGVPQDLWLEETVDWEQTNSGMVSSDATVTPRVLIAELRRRSGLTWDELARLCGVSRRSLHFWASGESPNAGHQERLMRLVNAIHYVDRGSAANTRAALVTSLDNGEIPFDLLMRGEFAELKQLLGAGTERAFISLSPLTVSARLARMPISPGELVDALQDSVHREAGRARAARTVRATRDQ